MTTHPSPKKLVYQYITELGTATKADLLEKLELTGTTMTRILDELTNEKLILESGFGPSNGGRRPILYQTNPSYGYFLGLEISRFYSTLGLFDMQMNPMSLTRWRMDKSVTPEVFIKHVTNNVRSILRDHQLRKDQIIGMGIGAVGPLNREKGVILKPLYFPADGWNHIPICNLLEEAIGIPVKLENGANAALLAEHWALRQEHYQHMLYVHAGVGIRSAMMSYGQLVHGQVDMEGSIGQMIIQTDGRRLHQRGNYGALEAYATLQALELAARSDAKLGNDDLLTRFHIDPDEIRYDHVLSAISQGSDYALQLLLRSATYFGIGLANLINAFHPEVIILGGALVNSHEQFYQSASETAKRNMYYYPEYSPVFTKGQLKEDAVATGAALMLWKSMSV